jgi:hypothetical protein
VHRERHLLDLWRSKLLILSAGGMSTPPRDITKSDQKKDRHALSFLFLISTGSPDGQINVDVYIAVSRKNADF